MSTDLPPTPDSRSELVQFILLARDRGSSDEFISKLLRDYGWPTREVERAFFEVYEGLVGRPLPTPRGGSGELARDAFFYLLAFVTLGIWIQALGEMAFIFINHLIPDSLNNYYGDPSWRVAFALARLLVAYPVYLGLMRQINRDLAAHREKHFSEVRKVLTYLTLLIATIIAISAVIAFLTSFLRGELTPRFLLKVLVVLVLDGGVLWYYFDWIRRKPAPKVPNLAHE
ncbi:MULTISPECIES: DUF5671 domain-containing protein [Cyanophyceae]|uniref:DUF5671 domain-containing protein n=1 Tax=Cyanophyceae TaxID=3028117 RepID=UPI0016889C7F|nr:MULTISPECIES: DUF5671 domain-containing protein [Cyanophyceae]MBD1915337.1 hypothetical protein [Phormidium sp. FACHB-77]MBD2028901.1 hypothetical protein [Phormidium sp. FACHB-322]MBD2049349.1 hypothetical protein [Leptolyngbya sp. FACHB-60]